MVRGGHILQTQGLSDLRTSGEIDGQMSVTRRQSHCLEPRSENLEVRLNDRAPAWDTIVRSWGHRHRSGVECLPHKLTAWAPSPELPRGGGSQDTGQGGGIEGGLQTQSGVGVNSLSEPRTQTPCRKARCMCDTWLMRLAVS